MNKQFLLSAAMIAISLTAFTACSDSDNDNNSETPPTEVTVNAGQRMALASVLNVLTGQEFNDTADIDFEGRTFEPTYGEVRDESRQWEHSIKVRSAVLAEAYFRGLASAAPSLIQDTDDGYVIDLTNLDTHSSGRKQNFGKLTFHRGSGADNVGYADVEIPCIPSLERITYKTQEQWGDNGGFESPIGYGEVFFGNGLYWICVREATAAHPSLSGALVNIQPGKSEGWEPIYNSGGDKKAAWRPSGDYSSWQHRYDQNYILDYINLCSDSNFKRQKRRIMNQFYGSKVFPRGYLWHYVNGEWILNQNIAGPGFANLEHEGWAHWAHEPWGVHGIAIVLDAWEGNYRSSRAKWWRCASFCCTNVDNAKEEEPDARMGRCNWNCDVNDFRSFVYFYTDPDDFGEFLNSALVYTARIEKFTTSIPKGFTKIDI